MEDWKKKAQDKLYLEWGDVLKEFLRTQPMYIRAKEVGPKFFGENPGFRPDSTEKGKLGVVCDVFSESPSGYVWKNPYFVS